MAEFDEFLWIVRADCKSHNATQKQLMILNDDKTGSVSDDGNSKCHKMADGVSEQKLNIMPLRKKNAIFYKSLPFNWRKDLRVRI